jgi:hypothetical protein
MMPFQLLDAFVDNLLLQCDCSGEISGEGFCPLNPGFPDDFKEPLMLATPSRSCRSF